jgi:glutathione S-transferase
VFTRTDRLCISMFRLSDISILNLLHSTKLHCTLTLHLYTGPYCQKVWLTLEEKKIPYKVEKINMRCYGEKPASFMRIQPGGQIPVAIIDHVVYGQSNDILFALEEKFPEHKTLTPPASSVAQQYFRLERQLFSAWMYWLTGNGGNRAKSEVQQVLTDVEGALQKADGPFFMGKDITLVDVQFSSFLERMAASLLFYKGFQIRVAKGEPTEFPNLNAWFDAMETLPSYQLTKSDYYTHCWDLPPQLGGCVREPSGKPYEDAINGLRSLDGTKGSWENPLQPHNGGVEPDWEWAGDEQAARREAVERVSTNNEAIVKFAARGAGRKGMPAVMAPLSDPNAVPNEAVQPAVDQILRLVCLALLDGVDADADAEMTEIAKVLTSDGGLEYAEGVIASLAYMRERVGVPRDMKLPAARQLRAHLNWAVGKILEITDQ